MTLPVVSLLFFGSGVIVISAFVLLKRWDRLARSWLFFSVFVGIYAFGYAYFSNNDVDYETALWAARIGTTSAAIIPLTWFHFVCTFLNLSQNKIFWIIVPLTFLFIVVGMTDYFIPAVASAKSYLHYPVPGPLYYPHVINFIGVVSYGFLLMLISYWKEKNSESRKEILSLLSATIVGFIAGGSQFSLILLRDRGFDLTVFLVCYPFLMAYAMIKHRALDVEKIADAFQREKLAAIGLLSASINHEIRSPLFVIKGYAETLLDRIENGVFKLSNKEQEEKVTQVLQKSIEQTERIVDIAQRLIDFSKPAPERKASESTLLNEAVDNVIAFVEHGLKVNHIQVEKTLRPDLALRSNRKELEQILLNLVLNASQAMEKKGGKIRIEASERVGRVEIRVSDTGPGIPPDKIAHIFEPFFTTKQSGTGLGLYVTKQLVERNRGKISAESKPGQGAVFILEFHKAT